MNTNHAAQELRAGNWGVWGIERIAFCHQYAATRRAIPYYIASDSVRVALNYAVHKQPCVALK